MLPLLISCNDEDRGVEDEGKGIVEIRAFYTLPGSAGEIPDSQSRIYVFYGKYSTDYSGYSLINGKLVDGASIILPDEVGLTGNDGSAILRLEYADRPFTLLVEGNHYGRCTAYSYASAQKKIIFRVVFNP